MVEGHWRPGCEACRWNHFCSLGATHLQKMNGDCGSENQTTLPGKKAEKLDSWSWSCQAVIGVDWIYFIFTPFLLVEIPPSSMIQQIFMVGPIPMSLGKSHHACCILFVCLLFLSRWKVDPTQGDHCWPHFLYDKPSVILCLGDNWRQFPPWPTKSVLRKGCRCLRWAQYEMRASRRITINIIQPDENLTGWWLGHPSEKYESQWGWLATQY